MKTFPEIPITFRGRSGAHTLLVVADPLFVFIDVSCLTDPAAVCTVFGSIRGLSPVRCSTKFRSRQEAPALVRGSHDRAGTVLRRSSRKFARGTRSLLGR